MTKNLLDQVIEHKLSESDLSYADPRIKAAIIAFVEVGLSVQDAIEKIPEAEVYTGSSSQFANHYPGFMYLYERSELFSEPNDIIELAEIAGHVTEVAVGESKFLIISEPRLVAWYRQYKVAKVI